MTLATNTLLGFARPLGVALGFTVIGLALGPRLGRHADAPSPAGAYSPEFRTDSGPQIVMVYFGKASCAWSNQPSLPGEVERIKLGLRKQARARGASFRAAGVALDWSPERGLTHLMKFGQFDELSTGNSWGNSLALKYFGDDFASGAATPTIVVVERMIDVSASNTIAASLDVRSERLLTRKVGVYEIEQWLDNGLPLPR